MQDGDVVNRFSLEPFRKSVEPISDLAPLLGITLTGTTSTHCINPEHDDKRPSMLVKPDGVICLACGFRADGIGLISKFVFNGALVPRGDLFMEVLQWIHEHCGAPAPVFDEQTRERWNTAAEIYDIYDQFWQKCQFNPKDSINYLHKRGLPLQFSVGRVGLVPKDSALTDPFWFGPDGDKIGVKSGLSVPKEDGKPWFMFGDGCAIFPIRRYQRITGFYGRLLKPVKWGDLEAPRHRFTRTPPALADHWPPPLYGLDEAEPNKPLYLVEGIIDAATLHAHGLSAVAASKGQMSKAQADEIIAKRPRSIIIAYDHDVKTREITEMRKRLDGETFFREKIDTYCLEWGDLPEPTDINDWLNGRSLDEFNKLDRTEYVRWRGNQIRNSKLTTVEREAEIKALCNLVGETFDVGLVPELIEILAESTGTDIKAIRRKLKGKLPKEENEKRQTVMDAIMAVTDTFLSNGGQVFREESGVISAFYHRNGVRECYSTGHSQFLAHISSVARGLGFNRLSTDNLKEVTKQIALRAEKTIKLYNRFAFQDGRILIDRCSPDGEVIVVTAKGVSLEKLSEPLFRSNPTMLELPRPEEGGDATEWSRFVAGLDYSPAQILLMVWSALSVHPGIQRPALILYGPPGTGKSTIAELLRDLVDPSTKGTLGIVEDIRNLALSLSLNAIVPLDNISRITKETSDLLCRALTGGVVEQRKLYTNDEVINLDVGSAIILNGISNPALRGDLLDRALLIQVDPLIEELIRPRSEILADWNSIKAKLLGTMLRALAHAMRRMEEKPSEMPKIKSLHRFGDFVRWGLYVSEGLGIERDAFLSALGANKGEILSTATDTNVVISTIIEWFDENEEGRTFWEGRPMNAHQHFGRFFENQIGGDRAVWPKTAHFFIRLVNENIKALENAKITVTRKVITGRKKIIFSRKT